MLKILCGMFADLLSPKRSVSTNKGCGQCFIHQKNNAKDLIILEKTKKKVCL